MAGSQVRLNCCAIQQNQRASWYFQPVGSTEHRVLTEGRSISSNLTSRYNIVNETTDQFDLIITQIKSYDAGRYACTVTLDTSVATFDLTVLGELGSFAIKAVVVSYFHIIRNQFVNKNWMQFTSLKTVTKMLDRRYNNFRHTVANTDL